LQGLKPLLILVVIVLAVVMDLTLFGCKMCFFGFIEIHGVAFAWYINP
jgi:hypothetical protein